MKPFPLKKLNNALRQALSALFPKSHFPGNILETPKQGDFGDYSSTVPLKLSKETGTPPHEIAKRILENFEIPEEFSKPDIKGAGFINFSYTKKFLAEFLHEIGGDFGSLDIGKGKTIVTDTSHPNVAKPMGVHHLLSTIIGNSLNRLFAYAGYQVVRDNYIGDFGTQFGKLIYAIRAWGNLKNIMKNPEPVLELLALYVRFHEEAEKNPALEDLGRAEFKKLETGDKENRKLWKWILEVSMKEFQKIYKRLDVSFDVIHGESFYEDKMDTIIKTGTLKDIFTVGEEGALIVKFPDEKYPPAVIRKKDGATLYITRDLARTAYWEKTWHPEKMVICADSAQKLHFAQLFETVKMLGLTNAENVHVLFGRMRFPEKKMSTRKGNIVPLEELLDEAILRAREIVETKNPTLPKKEKDEISEKVGIGAVKYTILSQNRETDTVFTWERMLSLEGDSGPYLQYAYARARSILRKAGKHIAHGAIVTLEEPQEVSILRMFPKFPEIIEAAVNEYRPSTLAHYLADLASKFNSFYAVLPVLQAEDERIRTTRLKLVYAVSNILKTGLNLLGIDAPERM